MSARLTAHFLVLEPPLLYHCSDSQTKEYCMAIKIVTLAGCLIFFTPQLTQAQAITEYGKVVGGAKERHANTSPKASRGVKQRGNDKSGVVQSLADVPSIPLPSTLTAESKGAALHARHDELSDKLADVSQGEILVPVAETTAGNTHWYMVKTQKGLIGWVKSADVAKESSTVRGQ